MKGEMESKAFSYIVKAYVEIERTINTAKAAHIQLDFDDGVLTIQKGLEYGLSRRNVSMKHALSHLKRLINMLSNEKRKNISPEDVVYEILLSIAVLNKIDNDFRNIKIELDCDSFDGHFYEAITSMEKAMTNLCHINDESEMDKITMTNLDDVYWTTKELSKKYDAEITEEIERIMVNW